jgi:hypothetical protein
MLAVSILSVCVFVCEFVLARDCGYEMIHMSDPV